MKCAWVVVFFVVVVVVVVVVVWGGGDSGLHLAQMGGGQIRGDSLPKVFYGRIWDGRRLRVGWGVLYRWCFRRV